MLSSKIIKLLIAAAGLLLSACAAVGPDYVKPAVAIPPAFKESEGWKVAQPKDPVLPERWWQLFHDPVLNELEEQVSISNQNIAVAEAQFRQARALTDASRAASYPTVSVGASATRAQTSANTGRGQSAIATDFLLPANLSWEIDLWGRIRRSVEASSATFQASAAELAAARLSAQAALATNYYQLRTARQTVLATSNQYKAGVVGYINVIVVQTAELANRSTANAILGRRMAAAVLLVKALGGGWDASTLREVNSSKQ